MLLRVTDNSAPAYCIAARFELGFDEGEELGSALRKRKSGIIFKTNKCFLLLVTNIFFRKAIVSPLLPPFYYQPCRLIVW